MASKNEEDKCPICRENFTENDKHTLDCEHRFHAHCIIRWFRSGNSSCPSCRGTQDFALSFADVETRADMVKNYAKSKKAPSTLKKIIARNNMIKRNVRKSTKALVSYKKNKEVKEMLKKISKLERKKKYWKNLQEVYVRVLGLYTDNNMHLPPVVSFFPIVP